MSLDRYHNLQVSRCGALEHHDHGYVNICDEIIFDADLSNVENSISRYYT